MNNNNVMKTIFKLQRAKLDLMLDTITDLSELVATNAHCIPRDVTERFTEIVEHFLKVNEKLDELRQKNVDNFYGNIKDNLENIYKLEVSDEEDKK